MSATLIVGMMSGITVYAAADSVEVIFTDVTSTDQTTLAGEAKIMVSVKGAGGDVTIAQTALTFSGDLKYKSIEFLKGENNPAAGNAYITPNGALVNSTNELVPSITCARTPMSFTDDVTDLFILTFSGDEGDEVTLSLNQDDTYYTVNGLNIDAEGDYLTATASDKDVVGKSAVVKLTMDKVTDFAAVGNSNYENSDVTLTITSENPEHKGYTIHTVLNNILVSKGNIAEYAKTAMASMVSAGIIKGDNGNVNPLGNATRAEVAVMCARLMEIMN